MVSQNQQPSDISILDTIKADERVKTLIILYLGQAGYELSDTLAMDIDETDMDQVVDRAETLGALAILKYLIEKLDGTAEKGGEADDNGI